MKISNELKVGLLALVAIAVLVVGYNFLKGKNLFETRKSFTAEYERVDGLLVGNPVQVQGFNVGIVDDIRYLTEKNRILVTMLVDDEIQVPANADAAIVSSGLMGDMAVRLDLKAKPGMSGFAESGDVLNGVVERSITETLTVELVPIKQKMEELFGTLDTLLNVVRVNLSSERIDNIMGSVDKSMTSISAISRNLESATSGIDGVVDSEVAKIHSILQDISSITSNLESNNSEINKAVKNASKITEDIANSDLKGTMDGLKSTMASAQESIAGLSKMLASVEEGNGTLGKAMKDDGVYDNLEKSLADLDKLLIDMRENPKRYVSFSVFSRKDKKSKGEQPIPADQD